MTTVLPDSPELRAVVERSADPDAARTGLLRLASAHAGLATDLAADPTLAAAATTIACASDSLLATLEAEPVALDLLRDRADLAIPRSRAQMEAGVLAALAADDDGLRALRRWKRLEYFRVAARDLLGLADLRVVGRELSALAAAALGGALAIAAPGTPMAVIGMGKLGGGELNYSSDVDVMFVHSGEQGAAEAAARRVLAAMTTPTADGIVFRTDANLRPEGRSGALSRSLDAYAAYWERWAHTWEYQALLKARPVAGDAALGAEFLARAQPHVWRERLDPGAVREIRAMKERTEARVRAAGLEGRELKRGAGGIRDIEFSVQLLQLVHGRDDTSARSPNTLDALEALAAGGYVSVGDAEALDGAYVWLRTVEHRLQLRNDQQTHTLPDDPAELTRLARVLGFRDRGATSALAAFEATQQRRRSDVRALHEKLFFAPLLETLAGAGQLSPEAAEDRLVAFGFSDLDQTRAALQELTSGLTRRSRVMQQLLPVVLGWLSESPDPDLGLLQLRRLTEGYTRSAMVSRAFRETPLAAERACRILGSSRVLGLALHRQPEFLEALADDDQLRELGREELVAEALDALNWRESEEGRATGLRRFKRRHLLRIGTRDLLGLTDVAGVGRELAHLADACVEAALRSLEPTVPFAVVGMGRLGGLALSYASDIDVLFVYDGDTPSQFDAAEKIATRLMRAIGATTAEGQTFRIDARLRPEGKQGPLARSLGGYRAYYERYALTWEFQALLRTRPIAGDPGVAAQFMEMIGPFVYRDPFPDSEVREVRRMKARIEKERIPGGEDPRFNLKLGRGSLSDVEFTAQLLQLQHGAHHLELRTPDTLLAPRHAAATGLVETGDAAVLEEAYRLCERTRNYRYLLTGTPSDSLPGDPRESEQVGRMLGYVHRPDTSLRDDYRRATRRARDVVERLFYGRE